MLPVLTTNNMYPSWLGDNEVDEDSVQNDGSLPAMWWLGILIAVVVIRVAYEMAK